MTSRDFCYWLQGFFELADDQGISPTKASLIQKHLALVFKHEIDPSMGGPVEQAALNQIHSPLAKIGGGVPDGTSYRC